MRRNKSSSCLQEPAIFKLMQQGPKKQYSHIKTLTVGGL